MEEVAHLIIRVSADQADAAKAKLKQLGFAAKETQTATGGLMSAWKGLTGLLAGTVGIGTAIAGLSKLVDTAKQFESLEAQLKTATGSAENAKAAFEAIQDFASQTPYDLAQATEAFIKLVNLGLTPSERALRSYGDTASAMGKDLSQMVQAVANATTGEFEMLKQFGVKARTEADGIAFSFRGVTTKVKNDARSIEEYFISLGEANFGGAMAERMATLEGKLSNLGDAWDVLFATIANAGAGELIKQAIDVAISAVQELTDMIASGELGGYIDAVLLKFEGLANDIGQAFVDISNLLSSIFGGLKDEGGALVSFLIAAFKEFPENVRAYIKGMGATWGLFVEYGTAAGRGIYEAIAGYFNLLIETAKNVGKEIYSNLNPLAEDFDFVGAQARAMEEFGKRTVNAWDDTVASINNASDAYGEVITEIMDERDATLAAYDAKVEASKRMREAYDREKESRQAAGQGTDRLAKFGVGGKSATAEFEKLRESLRTEQQALAESYAKRKQLIIDNTAAESQLRADLLAQLKSKYGEEKRAMLEKVGQDLEVRATMLEDQNAVELAIANQGYADKQRALQDALDARIISQEEYNRRSKQLEERHAREVGNITTQHFAQTKASQLTMYGQVLGMAGDIAGQLQTLSEMAGKNAKGAFIAAKAIAIAQAIVYTELAAVRALAEGGAIAGIPLSTAIRALGYTSVALMTATAVAEYGQKYEHGGMIPAGKTGITQEAGFELVRGPAVVTSARATADMLAGSGQNGASPVSVVVNNYTDAEATVEEREGPDGKIVEVLLRKVKGELASDIRNGGSAFARAIEATYALRRGVA